MKNYKSIAKKGIALWVMTVLLTFTLKACNKDKVELPIGTITLTTAKSEVGFTIRIPKDSQNLTIDWGDGKKSNVNDASWDIVASDIQGNDFHEFRFVKDYSNTTKRTIVISGPIIGLNCRDEQITHLDLSRIKTLVSLDCSQNMLNILDVSTNTLLYRLECDFNQLTSLDVSKNKSLIHLSCVGNELTASALNDLFRSLPFKRGEEYGERGVIFIRHRYPGPLDNPGAWDCDRSIATERGWVFMTLRH